MRLTFNTDLQAPGHALQDILAPGQAHLLSLPPVVQRDVLNHHPVYRAASIPAHTYPGQTKTVTTLSATAMLITRHDFPEPRVKKLLDGLHRSVDAIAQDNLRIGLLSSRTAIEGLALPMHPAAERFYNR